MENNSPEIRSNQEYKSEIRLSPEIVNQTYSRCLLRDGEDNSLRVDVHDLINSEVFNADKIKIHRDTIEKLANQMQSRFFNKKASGYDSGSAVFDKYQTKWDDSKYGDCSKRLLSLFSAIGIGEVTTTSAYLRAVRGKEKNIIRYLLNSV